jgi:hypothetical protein
VSSWKFISLPLRVKQFQNDPKKRKVREVIKPERRPTPLILVRN